MENKKGIQNCDKYTLIAGRIIACGDTELFGISREPSCSPTEADAMAHYIVDTLNKRKDFKQFYDNYMGRPKAFTVNSKDLFDKKKNPNLSLSVKDVQKNKKIPKTPL